MAITHEILDTAALAARLGLTPAEIGDTLVTPAHAALVALADRLDATFDTTEAVGEYLRAPNRFLSLLTPLEVVRVGRVERVHAALDALDAGIFI